MKFSEIEKEQWEELKPYLDTCLLPITGLTGDETPWQATDALEKLRDTMDWIEIPYKGRIVTYPALHYMGEAESFVEQINTVCKKLKDVGFHYLILISADPRLNDHYFEEADLFISAKEAKNGRGGIGQLIETCWARTPDSEKPMNEKG
ncbi:DUF2487 family protein [Paenibacillus sp. J2TS4]|uniref:DUF2487 family protein n=1 Tax=Paenibacillus sp. J2TS4 TaxID=2807194 RepID=UPI001B02DAE2|nr:DUF2487 family protein [Paenibacillus sp. J2TS4]GIP32410.1 hypothetical protein J2TS4_16200 [Paenibacillus sp. J2TS4]